MPASSLMEQITLRALMSSHENALDFLLRNSRKAVLDIKTEGELRLAVDEIVTNIITHGYAEHGIAGDLTLTAMVTPETFAIVLEDTAPPFDPRSRPAPESLNEPLETRPVGGVGLLLVMKSVDRFDYEYVEGKNRNTLIVNRNRPQT